MRTAAAVAITYIGFAVAVGLPRVAHAQVPTRTSEPRLVAPASQSPALTPSQPTTAPAAPAADTTAPAAPAPVTAVSGSAGVTTIPATSGATSSSAQAATMASDKRGYVAGKFALALDGVQAAWLKGAEGGSPTSDVVNERLGADHIVHKHLAGVKYEDISFSTGIDSKPLTDWIAATWNGTYIRKDGSIVAATYDSKAVSERQFFHALITETTFPALDAASKDVAFITVKISPEYTRLQSGSAITIKTPDLKPQKWLPSNFRFEMAGLDGSRVNRIDPFTITNKVVESAVGEVRDYEKVPAHVEFPNLTITLSSAASQSWSDWLDDFVVKGNNGQDKERNGAIVYLDPSKQTELGRINLFNCGIVRLTPQKLEAGAENIRRETAELYCERMEFQAKGAVN